MECPHKYEAKIYHSWTQRERTGRISSSEPLTPNEVLSDFLEIEEHDLGYFYDPPPPTSANWYIIVSHTDSLGADMSRWSE